MSCCWPAASASRRSGAWCALEQLGRSWQLYYARRSRPTRLFCTRSRNGAGAVPLRRGKRRQVPLCRGSSRRAEGRALLLAAVDAMLKAFEAATPSGALARSTSSTSPQAGASKTGASWSSWRAPGRIRHPGGQEHPAGPVDATWTSTILRAPAFAGLATEVFGIRATAAHPLERAAATPGHDLLRGLQERALVLDL